MPLYEYACSACRHEFEQMQKFSDASVRKCPSCGKLKVTKKISLAGFQLKGAGWYKDGYVKSSGAAEKPADGKTTDGKTTEKTTGEQKTGGAGASVSGTSVDAGKKTASTGAEPKSSTSSTQQKVA